ncbi:MAG: glycosyltransferase [Candidatus Eisenbacteria bacterium]|nr:glycosyltransferase [Candidatus Eisenbacteria bacterium]
MWTSPTNAFTRGRDPSCRRRGRVVSSRDAGAAERTHPPDGTSHQRSARITRPPAGANDEKEHTTRGENRVNATVLFDARLVLGKPTGIGRYIASILPELVRRAPETTFRILRREEPWPGYELEGVGGPNVEHVVTSLPHMSLRQHVELPRVARRLGADLLHYPHFDAPVDPGGVPVVVTIHDTKQLPGSGLGNSLPLFRRLALRVLMKRTLTSAAAVISVSKTTSESLERFVPGCSDRTTVVYEASDPDFRPASERAVEVLRRARSLERPFVLTVSERRPHKNIEGLLRSYARSRCRSSHDLVVVGRPWRDYRGPERALRELGLSTSVRILGDVAHDELVAFYTAADAFALVSFYEGFGLPLLEAMACKTPVVASTTSAAGEIVGDAGVKVDPTDHAAIADALDRVVLDRELHDSLIERGLDRESEFTWGRAAEETLDVYRRVLEGRPAARRR